MSKVEIPTLLAETMKRFPEQRAMQVIFNALDAKGWARDKRGQPRDLFYITNGALAAALIDYRSAPSAGEQQ